MDQLQIMTPYFKPGRLHYRWISLPSFALLSTLLSILIILFLTACSPKNNQEMQPQEPQPQDHPPPSPFQQRNGNRMNLTPEQGDAFMKSRQEMMLAMQEACKDRLNGDPCTLNSPRGERTGSCQPPESNQDSNQAGQTGGQLGGLICRVVRQGRGGFNRNLSPESENRAELENKGGSTPPDQTQG